MGDKLDKRIGARVRYFRTEAGYTQTDLAELVGCESTTIGSCEIGKDRISLTLLNKIAETLRIDLYKFLIPRVPDGNKKTIEDIEKLLLTANDTQLGLIYSTISGILDLTTLED